MTIINREPFLQRIAERLGRSSTLVTKPKISWEHSPQTEVLKDASIETLVQVFIEQCKNIHTTVEQCDMASLLETLEKVIQRYNYGSIIYTNDERFEALQIESFLHSQPNSFRWDSTLQDLNKEKAEQANIGIVISDLTLAESGTIMLQTRAEKGRVISFLPTHSIAIIPKSSIVPRFTQAAQLLRKVDDPLSSCINFITGPSNSADIEMNLVVGVHGPVKMTYIIVEDY